MEFEQLCSAVNRAGTHVSCLAGLAFETADLTPGEASDQPGDAQAVQ